MKLTKLLPIIGMLGTSAIATPCIISCNKENHAFFYISEWDGAGQMSSPLKEVRSETQYTFEVNMSKWEGRLESEYQPGLLSVGYSNGDSPVFLPIKSVEITFNDHVWKSGIDYTIITTPINAVYFSSTDQFDKNTKFFGTITLGNCLLPADVKVEAVFGVAGG